MSIGLHKLPRVVGMHKEYIGKRHQFTIGEIMIREFMIGEFMIGEFMISRLRLARLRLRGEDG